MKTLINRLRPTSQKGQSLVEMAITAPILIFMLIGVFEVGWALRGYLVLTNVNREITRFAIRPGYLDYSIKNPTITAAMTVGYDKVLSYTYSTLADQLPLEFSTGETSTLIISHLVVDTGDPCTLDNNNRPDCNCNDFVTDPDFYLTGENVYTHDDIILHPERPGYNYYYVYTFPLTSPYRTQLNYPEMAAQMARENNKFNCDLLKKSVGTVPAANNVIATEVYYRQPQLFGFPLISNPLTDPVPMYTHTVMRMIVASRTSNNNVDTVGPLCIAYPFTLKSNHVISATQGTIFDILGGEPPAGNSDRGYLAWDPQWNQTSEVREEIAEPRTSFSSYKNTQTGIYPNDTTLSMGDWVASAPGDHAGVLDQVLPLVGQEIVIPVFDDFCKGSPQCGTTTVASYHIFTFIRVEIINYPPYDLNLNNSGGGPNIWARYIEPAWECLQ